MLKFLVYLYFSVAEIRKKFICSKKEWKMLGCSTYIVNTIHKSESNSKYVQTSKNLKALLERII